MSRRHRRDHGAVATLALGFAAAAVAAPAFAADRLLLSASGATLNTASGGGGGSLTWLHDVRADTLLGLGAEYDTVADAHWTVGTVSAALSGGPAANRWTLTARGRFGAGDIGAARFDYDVEAVGVTDTLSNFVTLQLETRQFDVDTTHGNLPKAGVELWLGSHWLLGAAYARSMGGNLGTEYESVRVNHFGGSLSWFAGGAQGHVAPPVLNVEAGTLGPVPRYWDAYGGITKTFATTQWTVSADYLDLLAGTRRITLTLTCALTPRND